MQRYKQFLYSQNNPGNFSKKFSKNYFRIKLTLLCYFVPLIHKLDQMPFQNIHSHRLVLFALTIVSTIFIPCGAKEFYPKRILIYLMDTHTIPLRVLPLNSCVHNHSKYSNRPYSSFMYHIVRLTSCIVLYLAIWIGARLSPRLSQTIMSRTIMKPTFFCFFRNIHNQSIIK